ncbi:MAG: hypothetical protein J2P15_07420 [Micromonosporaceae bacterium]|nr:hypothetical protein [Micromonosporaceae bacterium]
MPVEAQRLRWAWYQARQIVVLLLVAIGTVTGRARSNWQPQTALVYGCLAVVVAGWLVWLLGRPSREAANRLTDSALLVWLAAGLLVAIARPFGAGLAFPALALLQLAIHGPERRSVTLALGTCAVYIGGQFLAGGVGYWVLAGPAAFVFATMAGIVRRGTNRAAEQIRLADAEKANSAALAERARIAREIHDVLAHSLAALTVQLETADALLEGGTGDRVQRARQAVVRAGQLAREGLAETRQAIGALRGEAVPLPQLLETLATGYRADFGAPAVVRVEGIDPDQPAPPLSADAGQALYRGAQEAMTNVRKHAPGAPVTVELRYAPEQVSLVVANGQPPAAAATPRPGAPAGGGGYGLVGLRERAELAGGTVEAGPAGGGYRVDVKIPW